MEILRLICQGICIALFVLSSTFVFIFGKKNSGIYLDYFLSCVMLCFLMWSID